MVAVSDTPCITTVIPTYRRPALLRRAIQSALSQTYRNIRVLVSDNASGDETAQVVEELSQKDPRIIYHVQPENIGPVGNFQYGMDAVETEYFSFLSDDDFLLPDFYRTAMESLSEHPGAKFFCGQCVNYDQQRGTHSLHPTRNWNEGLHEARASTRLMIEHFFLWTACVFDSGIRETIGAFEPLPVGDILFLAKAAAFFPFVVTLRPCAVFVQSGKNTIDDLPVTDIMHTFDVMHTRCEEIPGLSSDERREIRQGLDRSARLTVNGMMRSSLARQDWPRFDAAVKFLDERGALDFRKRLRVSLALRRDPPSVGLRLMLRLLELHTSYHAMRRSGFKTVTLEEISKLYAG